MKKFLALLICIGLGYFLYTYREPIVNKTTEIFVPQKEKKEIIIPEMNGYKKDYDFLFVKNVANFEPSTSEDIKNVFYTTINSGWSEFSFFCPDEYINCIDDVIDISNDSVKLNQLNNFVEPFNSYQYIETSTSTSGTVKIKITKLYDDATQEVLNNKVNEIIQNNLNGNMTDREKIRTIHDYIINNTKYDTVYAQNGSSEHVANTAYGALMQGYAVCGGYADAMALFLDKLGIKNYKIASDTHVWNYVNIEDAWYHLDLTWDDPVIKNSNKNRLDHTYFLISTKDLEALNNVEHNYNKTVYIEAN